MLAGEPDPTQYDDLRTLKQAMNSDLPQGGAGLPLQHWSDERLRATFRLVQGERLWLALARDHEGRTDGAAHQVLYPTDQPVDVRGLGIERLAAGEGQEPVGQGRRPLSGALCGRGIATDVP